MILVFLPLISKAPAEDLRLVNGKVYRNITVERIDPDGAVITLPSKEGVKIFWNYLSPKDKAHFQEIGKQKEEDKDAAKRIDAIKIKAIVEPTTFGETTIWAHITPLVVRATAAGLYSENSSEYQNSIREVPDTDHRFSGRIEGKLPSNVGSGAEITLEMYEIGFTADSSRDRLFTMDRERAARYLEEKPK